LGRILFFEPRCGIQILAAPLSQPKTHERFAEISQGAADGCGAPRLSAHHADGAKAEAHDARKSSGSRPSAAPPSGPRHAQLSQIRAGSMIPASWSACRWEEQLVHTTCPQERQFVIHKHRCFRLRVVLLQSKMLWQQGQTSPASPNDCHRTVRLRVRNARTVSIAL